MTAAKLPTITILCPVYNESENVEMFYREFSRVILPISNRFDFQFLFADNCSTDDTYVRLKDICDKEINVKVIRYSRNFGVMKSIYTGIVNSSGAACAVFDCDLQDPPELLLEFIEQWKGGAKVVFGVRRTRKEGRLLGLLRDIYRRIEAVSKGYRIQIESGAWLLDQRVVHELRRTRFESYLAGLISRLGFKSVGVPYDRKRRELGTSKFGLVRYFSYATDGLVSGTIAPLRLSMFFGIGFAFLSFIFMIYFIVAKLFLGAPFANGVAAAIVIILFGFGLNFVLLGIIGEYVGRIYLEREAADTAIIDEVYPPLEPVGPSRDVSAVNTNLGML